MKPLPLIAGLLAAFPAIAAQPAIEFQCPKRISTTQNLAAQISGWRPSTDRSGNSEHYFTNVSFSEGIPEELATLVPDNEGETSGKVWTARWDFAKSEAIWLNCRYRDTTVVLSQQLPAGIKNCFVRFDNRKGLSVQRIWCQK